MPSVVRRVVPFLTPPIILAVIFVIAVLAVGAVFLNTRHLPKTSFSTVTHGPITEEVTATGMVAPTESVDLGFQRSGTIARINVAVGDHVSAGEVLATLSNADLSAAREQAAANLSAAQAKLDSLKSGTRPEQLATDRAAVAQAIQSNFVAADASVHNDIDAFVTNPRSSTPALNFSSSNSQLVNDFLNKRVQAEATITALQNLVPAGDVSSASNLTQSGDEARQDMLAIESLLDTASALLNSAIPDSSVTAADIAAYESSISAARTSVVTALQTLDGDVGALRLAEAGATSQDLANQQAVVDAAQAALDAANANLAQTVITAPIAGTITRQDGNAGEVVSMGQSFLSLNSDERFEVKAYVSEADIGKLAVGNSAKIALDAYPGVTFPASIVTIDPAATVQNGVPSYQVTAQFVNLDPRIKAGLTANMTVAAKKADDALLVPATAIITKGNQTYVLRVTGGSEVLTPVTVGIENAGGEAQIISGISEGDSVASFGSSAN